MEEYLKFGIERTKIRQWFGLIRVWNENGWSGNLRDTMRKLETKWAKDDLDNQEKHPNKRLLNVLVKSLITCNKENYEEINQIDSLVQMLIIFLLVESALITGIFRTSIRNGISFALISDNLFHRISFRRIRMHILLGSK